MPAVAHQRLPALLLIVSFATGLMCLEIEGTRNSRLEALIPLFTSERE